MEFNMLIMLHNMQLKPDKADIKNFSAKILAHSILPKYLCSVIIK